MPPGPMTVGSVLAGHQREQPLAGVKAGSRLATHALFIALVGASTFVRWRLLRDTPYPTGLDGGNWLALGHAMFGESIRSSTIVYPPLVPFLAVVLERLFGTYNGIKALALAAQVAPALGTYVLLYGWGLRWRAALLSGFLAASAGTGEAMAWGGYPQLFAIGILPVFILTIEHFLSSGQLRTLLAPAALSALLLATNDLVGPVAVLVGVLYFAIRYAFMVRHRSGPPIRSVLFGVGLSAVLTIPLLPIYLSLAPGIASTERAKLVGQQSALSAVGSVTYDLSTFWVLAFAIAILAPTLALARSRWIKAPHIPHLGLLSSLILVPTLILLVVTGEPRFAYLLPLGVIVGLAAWIEAGTKALPNWAVRSVDAAIATAVIIDVVVGTTYFAAQRDYYAVLTPDLATGLVQLQAISQPTQEIAVSPTVHNWEIGWWIEGAVRRRTVYAGNPVWLTYADERARNALANAIFSPDMDLRGSVDQARRAGISYLFVDKSWPDYGLWIGKGRNIDPRGIVYENSNVLIIATQGS
jgi:hypothetical protein